MITPSKRTRPVPENGLARAMSAGRHRRRVALGSGGGAIAVVAVVVVLVAGLGSPTAKNSLEILDDPMPTSSPSAAAPLPTSSSSAGAGETPTPAPSPTESDDCVNNDCNEVYEIPEDPYATPTPVASAAARTRPVRPYVEHPRQDGSCGSDGIPGTGWCTQYSRIGGVASGGSAVFTLWACAPNSSKVLTFTSGQEHELVIARAADHTEVYRFSKTVTFTEGPHQRTVDSGTCLRWDTTWDTGTTEGPLVPPGRYTATVSLVGTEVSTSPKASFSDSYDFDVYG